MKILNRQNELVDFSEQKILEGINKANQGTGETLPDNQQLVDQVIQQLNNKTQYPTTVDVNEVIPNVLMKQGLYLTATNFLAYATKHKLARANHKIDPITTIDEYNNKSDWRVKANANQGYSVGGMILNIAGKMVANYWLDNVYPEDAGFAHRNGDIHIHDLDCLMGYCAGWSLRTLLNEGFNGVDGRIQARPPKHFSAAIGQMVNFLGTLQNEWAGAQAFSSFDTYLAPFVRKRKLEIEQEYRDFCWQTGGSADALPKTTVDEIVNKRLRAEIMQQMQEFIYNLNVPSRWGMQTPFTNVTFDIKCPEDLKPQVPMIGGVPVDQLEFFKGREFTYGDLEDEMVLITQCYFEVMAKGDARGQIFTFPIPTLNIGKDFAWDDHRLDCIWEAEAKYGLAYFQNFVNSELNPNQIRSMCCRLQLDLRELEKRGNGLFGSAEQTGSTGVVTINCARLGYLHKGDKEGLYKRLDTLLDLAKKVLEAKRKFLTILLKNDYFPYTKRYLGTYKNHFNTIGVNGINEMLLNFNGESTATEAGAAMAAEFLDHIRSRLIEFQESTGNMYNLEATPGEGTCYRFAKEDKKQFGDKIIQAGEGENIYYNNSSQLPVGFTDDIFEALDLQENLQRKYTGGSVLHIFLGERVPSGEIAKQLVRKVFENYKVPYITLTPTFSICPKHGYLSGEHKYCPICDQELLTKQQPSCNC